MVGRPLGSRYVIGEVLGHGGMGQVFHGTDDTGAEYAVKLLRPELANDHVVVTRFVQERSILLGVTHPNVVRMHDLVIEGQTLAIVMDLVRGPDLRTALRSAGACPPAEVGRLCGQVARALAAVHAAGVVHRDVKPENVLLDHATNPPTARLSDFGISRLITGSETARTTVLMGTPLYMAPELTSGSEASPASDLYALGIMAYELSCGVSPFAASTITGVIHGHTHVHPGRPPGIVDPLWYLIEHLLAKNPAARPLSAATVAASFDRLATDLQGLPPAPAISAPPPGTPAPPRLDPGPASLETVLSPLVPTPPMPITHSSLPAPRTRAPRGSAALGMWAGFATALVVCLGVIVALALRDSSKDEASQASVTTQVPADNTGALSSPSPGPATPTPSPTSAPNLMPGQCTPFRGAPTNQALLNERLASECREDVLMVQRWLISCDYLPLRYDDGKYGPVTASAVIRFQREYSLDVDFVGVGPKTWSALQSTARQCDAR